MESSNPSFEFWMPDKGIDDPCLQGLFNFWFEGNSDVFTEAKGENLLELFRDLNIQPVIYDLLRKINIDNLAERKWMETLRTEALQIVGTCAYRHHIIETLAISFDEAGVKPIWLKGPGLANTVYPRAHWRTYKDLDLLISPLEWETAVKVLEQSGYFASPCLNWGYLSFEKAFQSINHIPGALDVELHCKLSNRPRLSVFSYDELFVDSTECSDFSFPFLVPHKVKHFIFVCLHRMGHHCNDRRFAWLMDIMYLVDSFTKTDWLMVLELSNQKKVSKVLLQNLNDMEQVLRKKIPKFVTEGLRNQGELRFEPSEIFLKPNRNKWIDLWTRWWDMPGLTIKMKYLLHWALPPKVYMNDTVGRNPSLVQHKDRLISGIDKYYRGSNRY